MKDLIVIKLERSSSISRYGVTIIVLICILVCLRVLLHVVMNPLTAVLILTDNLIPDRVLEVVFLIARGFIVPLRDIIEVSLICLMLRV